LRDFRISRGKDEEELLRMLAKSVSCATLASSQAAIYGLKAVLETMTDQPVKKVTTKLLDEAKDVAQASSPRGNIQETVKSTASVLGMV
jgi:HEPN domain-containing protein